MLEISQVKVRKVDTFELNLMAMPPPVETKLKS